MRKATCSSAVAERFNNARDGAFAQLLRAIRFIKGTIALSRSGVGAQRKHKSVCARTCTGKNLQHRAEFFAHSIGAAEASTRVPFRFNAVVLEHRCADPWQKIMMIRRRSFRQHAINYANVGMVFYLSADGGLYTF